MRNRLETLYLERGSELMSSHEDMKSIKQEARKQSIQTRELQSKSRKVNQWLAID